ncbi:NAD(P)/FAD-dependent oxidoreductase [Saccharopolyspora taberi]|uniref:NAD(P)/FAD-dependent oxidoreductase n=1 Tax=Saccharopolyspora taberi TaxID=60895 RepID=A0ABN3VFY6_9PSEU
MTDLDVAVVGAGIAGLTAAHELTRAGLDVRVFEVEPRVGGRMSSFRHEGYTIDQGAEQISLRGYRATWELLRRQRMTADEIPLIGKSIGVWRRGRAHPGIAERTGVLTGAGLSPRARLDLARFMAWASGRKGEFDPDRPESTPLGSRTIAEFARSYHPDLHDYLFQPLAGCFFGWDTERSTAASMVSLLLAVGDTGCWRTYSEGMDSLALSLAEDLDVVTGAAVQEVVSAGETARLVVDGRAVTARSVLLCVPAPVAARLHGNPPGRELAFLRASTFTPVLKVSCLLDRPLVPESAKPLYILLTPEAEDDMLSGIVVDHAKHPGRAPEGRGLLSLLANARSVPTLLDAPREDVIRWLTGAARQYLPGLAEANVGNFVHSFRHGLPEATPEALQHRSAFMNRDPGPVDYAGDWVMVRPASEGAVRSGALAASRTLARLRSRRVAA